jgi:hypothetical protein
MTKERYIDDVLGGAESEADRQSQLQQVSECLKTGGFGLKYVAKSGEPPPEEATADGETMSCLGHSWDPVNDTLLLEIDPMVVKKRVKGIKGIPAIDIKSEKELRKPSPMHRYPKLRFLAGLLRCMIQRACGNP